MPKRIVPLTDIKIKTTKPSSTEYKLFDGGGLYLLVTPTGGKLWRLKYRFESKERKLSLGAYPEVTLTDARRERDKSRAMLATGVDPVAIKKANETAGVQEMETFEAIAREWHAKFTPTWSKRYAESVIHRLDEMVHDK